MGSPSISPIRSCMITVIYSKIKDRKKKSWNGTQLIMFVYADRTLEKACVWHFFRF